MQNGVPLVAPCGEADPCQRPSDPVLWLCFTAFFLSCKMDSPSTYIYIFCLHNVDLYLKEIELIYYFTLCVCVSFKI